VRSYTQARVAPFARDRDFDNEVAQPFERAAVAPQPFHGRPLGTVAIDFQGIARPGPVSPFRHTPLGPCPGIARDRAMPLLRAGFRDMICGRVAMLMLIDRKSV